MADKRMMILPEELVKKIDENRGDMSQAEFIEFLLESRLKQEVKNIPYATKEEVYALEKDMKKLLRSFLDFFINYGLELGKQTLQGEFEELTSKLQGLQKDLDSDDNEDTKATIKWK